MNEQEIEEFVGRKMRQAKFHFSERDRLKELKDKQQEVAKGLVEEISSGDENEVLQFVNKWIGEGEMGALLEKMNELTKRSDDSRGWQEREKLTQILKVVFKDVRCQTKVVCPLYPAEKAEKYGKRQMITVGKCGFGIRYNIKSREIVYHDLDTLVARKDDIIAGLKKLKLKPWADKFEKFIACMPEVNERGEVVLEKKLKKSYDLLPRYDSEKVVTTNTILCKEQSICLKGENDEEYVLIQKYGYSKIPYSVNNGRCYGTVFQMREELLQTIKEYVAKLEEEVAIAEKSFEELRTSFAKELLLSGGGV